MGQVRCAGCNFVLDEEHDFIAEDPDTGQPYCELCWDDAISSTDVHAYVQDDDSWRDYWDREVPYNCGGPDDD